MNQRTPGRDWSPSVVRPEPPRDLDSRKFKLQAIEQDAKDLSRLSAQLQLDLQQLQNGVLSKDLPQNLKKMEKLSKRLRQAVTP